MTNVAPSRPIGRPPKPESERRRARGVRFSAREWAEVQRRAEAEGMSASAWLRKVAGV